MTGHMATARHAAAFAVLAVIALLVTPLVVERRATRLRSEISSLAEPAREDVSRIRLSLALEVSALRGYVINRERAMLDEYAEARATERSAFTALMAKAADLESDITAAATAARRASEHWNEASEHVARGEMSIEAFIARLPDQQARYRAALAAAVRLEHALAEFAAHKRAEIQRSERIGVAILTALTLLAATATALILHVSGSLDTQTALARNDPLTGLLNRRAFLEEASLELSRALRHRYAVTLAYFDVDDFKIINDTQGHAAGDALLKDIGYAIEKAIRKTDICARLGGDEFAVLFADHGPTPQQDATLRLRKAVLAELHTRGWPVTLSIGAVTVPRGEIDVGPLIHAADELMYDVKRESKNDLRWRSIESSARRDFQSKPPAG